MQPCDCFEMRELDIRDRELERIGQMISDTEDPNNIEKEQIEVAVASADEPPLEDKPKKKRKRRKRITVEE